MEWWEDCDWMEWWEDCDWMEICADFQIGAVFFIILFYFIFWFMDFQTTPVPHGLIFTHSHLQTKTMLTVVSINFQDVLEKHTIETQTCAAGSKIQTLRYSDQDDAMVERITVQEEVKKCVFNCTLKGNTLYRWHCLDLNISEFESQILRHAFGIGIKIIIK